jgi:hypothetical protein
MYKCNLIKKKDQSTNKHAGNIKYGNYLCRRPFAAYLDIENKSQIYASFLCIP